MSLEELKISEAFYTVQAQLYFYIKICIAMLNVQQRLENMILFTGPAYILI